MTPSANEFVAIPVQAEHPYEVRVGRDLLSGVPDLVPGATRLAVFVAESPVGLHDQVRQSLTAPLQDAGLIVHIATVPSGESAKTADVLQRCWDQLGSWNFTRNDAIVAVGGGTVTDVAGFVAATWLRGIRYIQVPTTLLAMVDASVGGKTGINTGHGKNLVGAFYSPVGVLCDLSFLQTLPLAELQSGLAEVVKVGLTSDDRILDLLGTNSTSAVQPTSPVLRELIERAIRVKAEVVGQDFRETASSMAADALGREVLNYGHTLGHAIERLEDYQWRHGAAIAVGMVFAAELAHAGGYLDAGAVDLHRRLLRGLDLPISYSGGRWPELLEAMQLDKKARGSSLRFVVLHGLGDPHPWRNPDPTALQYAYAAISS
ncbi:MAG: 3-dehydroquinate synthase [Actinomycetales bacterium]|nr:3-dehydroquinate synthase [Actinomycetales bacterium]